MMDYGSQSAPNGDVIKFNMTNLPGTVASYQAFTFAVQSGFIYEYSLYNETQDEAVGSFKIGISFPAKEWEHQDIEVPEIHQIADAVDYGSYPLGNSKQISAP